MERLSNFMKVDLGETDEEKRKQVEANKAKIVLVNHPSQEKFYHCGIIGRAYTKSFHLEKFSKTVRIPYNILTDLLVEIK